MDIHGKTMQRDVYTECDMAWLTPHSLVPQSLVAVLVPSACLAFGSVLPAILFCSLFFAEAIRQMCFGGLLERSGYCPYAASQERKT